MSCFRWSRPFFGLVLLTACERMVWAQSSNIPLPQPSATVSAASPSPSQSPAPSATTTSVMPAATEGAVPNGFYYYCASSKAYFPAAPKCPEPWIAIPIAMPVSAPMAVWVDPTPVDTSQEAVVARPYSLSLELFGRALVYSVDFDVAITDRWTLGVGYSNWESTDWWDNYDATVTVVPLYFNFYFSKDPDRGYLSAGVDWIHVTETGYTNDTFTHNGFAGTLGAGYESRSNGGFIFRIGAYAIMGRSVTISPSISLGFAF